MKTVILVTLVLAIFGCKKDEDAITLESYLNGKRVLEISTNPSGSKIFFLSSTLDPNIEPYRCMIPFIYQLSCTDGEKTLYFEGLRNVQDITVDENCNLYACMLNRIVKFTPPHDSITIKRSQSVFSSVISDNEGRIWAATYGDGLYYNDNYNWYRYSSHNSNITGNSISHLEIGKNGDIWLTSEGDTASVTYISGGTITPFKWKDLLGKNPNYINQLAVDKEGNAWVAYGIENTTNLIKLTKTGVLSRLKLDLVYSQRLVKIRTDYKGDLYMITSTDEQSKLYVYDNTEWKEVHTSIGKAYLQDATIDANLNLWLGTMQGIVKSTYQLVGSK